MRDRDLILRASPCDLNLYPDGPIRLASVQRSQCPHFTICNQAGFLGPSGHQCVMQAGTTMAKWTIKFGTNIKDELHNFRVADSSYPPKGWVYSSDRQEFKIITNREEALRRVSEFAAIVLGNSGRKGKKTTVFSVVGSRFEDVVVHATTSDGVIDLAQIEALEGRFGGRCDVRSGACSCGAWH